jgi:hypothetical protein
VLMHELHHPVTLIEQSIGVLTDIEGARQEPRALIRGNIDDASTDDPTRTPLPVKPAARS